MNLSRKTRLLALTFALATQLIAQQSQAGLWIGIAGSKAEQQRIAQGIDACDYCDWAFGIMALIIPGGVLAGSGISDAVNGGKNAIWEILGGAALIALDADGNLPQERLTTEIKARHSGLTQGYATTLSAELRNKVTEHRAASIDGKSLKEKFFVSLSEPEIAQGVQFDRNYLTQEKNGGLIWTDAGKLLVQDLGPAI